MTLLTRKTTNDCSATGGFLGRFWTAQDGAMSYVALVGSLIMMIFGGVGIDMMHAELKRNKVQQTLDRAVLSAANLNNTLDPESVVQDFFRAMNMEDELSGVAVDNGLGAKRVTADGHASISSDFLSLIGVSELDVYGRATAENAIAPTEISLVLDISGSMRGDKIAQLKDAAKEFVDTVLGSGGDNSRVTVSIVPYNATVNLGPELSQLYTLDLDHTMSTCAAFDSNDFNSVSLDPDQPLEQIAHFDPISNGRMTVDTPWCSTGTTGNIIAHSADPDALKDFIDSLEAQGNTAIDLGMKWGTALLDPSAQPVVEELANRGLAPETARYRPAPYEAAAQKFVVVMTDGQNTQQYDLPNWMKNPAAMSDVWVDDHGTPGTGDDRWSIRVIDRPGDRNDVFYWPHRAGRWNAYQNGPYSWVVRGAATMVGDVATIGQDTANTAHCSSYKGAGANSAQSTLVEGILSTDYADLDVDGLTGSDGDCSNYAPVRLNWQELFGTIKTTEYANTWYWQAYQDGQASYQQYHNAYYTWEVRVDGSAADNRLHRICDAAKDAGIVVYAIGVEAPRAGLSAMNDCASSTAHFYDVEGDELLETFGSISDMLVELRLTE
ncbi:VWA domain-containing protein [Sagittula sp. NFXS13]|uniref:VWA domain-containing protein n=1 Tax=Sagittula sp. NFXS13 TaxID=2819095 RepID=UPI0032DE5319